MELSSVSNLSTASAEESIGEERMEGGSVDVNDKLIKRFS